LQKSDKKNSMRMNGKHEIFSKQKISLRKI